MRGTVDNDLYIKPLMISQQSLQMRVAEFAVLSDRDLFYSEPYDSRWHLGFGDVAYFFS